MSDSEGMEFPTWSNENQDSMVDLKRRARRPPYRPMRPAERTHRGGKLFAVVLLLLLGFSALWLALPLLVFLAEWLYGVLSRLMAELLQPPPSHLVKPEVLRLFIQAVVGAILVGAAIRVARRI